MRNILLQKDKEELRKEYRFRKIILALVFVFFTTLVAIFLLIPSYITSKYKEQNTLEYADIISRSIEVQKRNPVGLVLNDTNTKLKLLSGDNKKVSFRKTVETIIKNKSEDIKIDGFLYTKKAEDKDETIVTGVASQRSNLQRFQRDLENEDIFLEAVLPTSNLASDKDIRFSIKVISKF